MKRARFLALGASVGLLLGGAGLLWGVSRSLWAAPPPLKVDRSKPLLLDDPPRMPESPDDRPVADNESCLVCHDDFREEYLALEHAKANVGCVKCHGSSAAHRDDEDNITPPDIMFAPAKIDSACKVCHEEHLASARKVIQRWRERCPQKTDPSTILCVDCHGAHRRPFRTVEWNKETRKLLVRCDPPPGETPSAAAKKPADAKQALPAKPKKPAGKKAASPAE